MISKPVRPDWQHRAACRGMDPELFFPLGEEGRWLGEIAVAREVCDTCPVRAECLEYALGDPSTDGIWGGTTQRQRDRIRRRRRQAS